LGRDNGTGIISHIPGGMPTRSLTYPNINDASRKSAIT
jgi:hypothetical protein